MRMTNTIGTVIVAIAALALTLISASAHAASYVGDKFPNFTFKDGVTGKDYSLEDFRGKVVLVDFWLTTCGPCVAAMPDLASLNQRFSERGLVVVGLTPESDSDVDLDRFMKAMPYIDWPTGYGAVVAFDQMGIFATPTYVVYDRSGHSTWGGHSLAQAEDAIVAALAKSTQPAEVE